MSTSNDTFELITSFTRIASEPHALPTHWHSAEAYRDRMLAARTLREARAVGRAAQFCIPRGWGIRAWPGLIAKATEGHATLTEEHGLVMEPLGHQRRRLALQAMSAMLAYYWRKHGLNPYREAQGRAPADGRPIVLDLASARRAGRCAGEADGYANTWGLGPAIAKRWFAEWYDPRDPRNASNAKRRQLRRARSLDDLLQ